MKKVIFSVAFVIVLTYFLRLMIGVCLEKAVKKKGRSSSPVGHMPESVRHSNEKGKQKLELKNDVPEVSNRQKMAEKNDKKSKKLHSEKYNNYQTCTTEGCKLAAKTILKSIDKGADPCENFYSFACGGFLKNTPIPNYQEEVSLSSMLRDVMAEKIRTLMSEPIKENEAHSFKQVKQLYATCMDEDKLEKLGLQPAIDMLRDLGGWPVVDGDKWNEGAFTWMDTIYKFRRYGLDVYYFFYFYVGENPLKSTTRIIAITEAALDMSREYYMEGMSGERVQERLDLMVNTAVLFGADRDQARAELKEALEFEVQLAHYTTPREEMRDRSRFQNMVKISDLEEKYKTIPWLKYINTLLEPAIQVTRDEIVKLSTPNYIKNLEILLRKTPKRVQANYVMYRGLGPMMWLLNKKARAIIHNSTQAVYGEIEETPRWKFCAYYNMQLAVDSMYVKRYFDNKSKEAALELVQNIRREMVDTLQSVDWMDEVSRKIALSKARQMISHIGYPDELLDPKNVDKDFEGMQIYPGEFFKSVLEWTKFLNTKDYEELRKPVDKNDWKRHAYASDVNARYSRSENSLEFPAGILQPPFFSASRPHYVNYGAFGAIYVAHEVTHAFDDVGSQYDLDGNVRDWWTPKTRANYIKKVQCVIDQYANYSTLGLNLNGVATQGENVADIGGIRIGYKAYKTWVEEKGTEEPRLPGLEEYNPMQMFWISTAAFQCFKYHPEGLKEFITTGSHAPAEFRVIGPISNQRSFARDFNCPKDSKMNPPKKCNMW